MNTAIRSANWNCPPGEAAGAACAQASEIKPFMVAVREAKRAALCHSAGRAPGGQELPGPRVEGTRGDCAAQGAHQPDVVVQVVDGVEPRAQDLVTTVEMAQVGAAEVAAGIAVAVGVDRREVGGEATVADVEDTCRGKQVTVARVTRRH